MSENYSTSLQCFPLSKLQTPFYWAYTSSSGSLESVRKNSLRHPWFFLLSPALMWCFSLYLSKPASHRLFPAVLSSAICVFPLFPLASVWQLVGLSFKSSPVIICDLAHSIYLGWSICPLDSDTRDWKVESGRWGTVRKSFAKSS